MRITKTIFESVHILEPKLYEDNRGFFYESYQKDSFKLLGINTIFMQDNHSYSKDAGTVRGMHFQAPPFAQIKLIRVLKGKIRNYFIDIRKNSPTYLQFDFVELSSDNKLLLYLPVGFANGFQTLEPDCEIHYKVDKKYDPDSDNTFQYNDTKIGIGWKVSSPILSGKDKDALPYTEIGTPFVYGENS